MTTTSAPASCTSSAVAAPIPVAPPTTSTRLPSYRNAPKAPIAVLLESLRFCRWIGVGRGSGDNAADLEVDDRVPVQAELGEDRVAVLVELGSTRGFRCYLVELHGSGSEIEVHPGSRGAL